MNPEERRARERAADLADPAARLAQNRLLQRATAMFEGAIEDTGKRVSVEDLVVKRDADGNVEPIDALTNSLYVVSIRPLTYGQTQDYDLRDKEVVDWPDEDKAKLIFENLAEPDLRGASGASGPAAFLDWLRANIAWSEVDDFCDAIVRFSHSRMRRLKIHELKDGKKKDHRRSPSPSGSSNGTSTSEATTTGASPDSR